MQYVYSQTVLYTFLLLYSVYHKLTFWSNVTIYVNKIKQVIVKNVTILYKILYKNLYKYSTDIRKKQYVFQTDLYFLNERSIYLLVVNVKRKTLCQMNFQQFEMNFNVAPLSLLNNALFNYDLVIAVRKKIYRSLIQ